MARQGERQEEEAELLQDPLSAFASSSKTTLDEPHLASSSLAATIRRPTSALQNRSGQPYTNSEASRPFLDAQDPYSSQSQVATAPYASFADPSAARWPGTSEADEDDSADDGYQNGQATPRTIRGPSINRSRSNPRSVKSPVIGTSQAVDGGSWRSRSQKTAQDSPASPRADLPSRRPTIASIWDQQDGNDGKSKTGRSTDQDHDLSQSETSFLAHLHLMSDEELDRLTGGTIRATSFRPSDSGGSRPSLAPLQANGAQYALSSPELPSEARFQSSNLGSADDDDTESPIDLCRKLSRALAASMAAESAARQALVALEEEHQERIDLTARRQETKDEAIRAVCKQHGLTGAIERAVTRALAEMPQVKIDVQEQVAAARRAENGKKQQGQATTTMRSGSIWQGHTERKSSSTRDRDLTLPISLREAMLDDMSSTGSHGFKLGHTASPSLASLAPPSATSIRATPRSSDGPRSRRSDSIVSTRSGKSSINSTYTGRKVSPSKLLEWNGKMSDRKASATIQATSPAAVEADGYMSDSGHPSAIPASVATPTSSRTPLYRNSSFAASTSAVNPPNRSSRAGSGFLSGFTWKKKKAAAIPPVPPLPSFDKLADPVAPALSTPTKPSSRRSSRPASVASASHLDVETDDTNVLCDLHDAIGSAPVSPSERPAHQLDMTQLPKPPSVRAIFLATRLLGPDATSLMQDRGKATSSLVAKLATDLISTARAEGLDVKDPVKSPMLQRRSPRSPAVPGSIKSAAGSENATIRQRPRSMAVEQASAIFAATTAAESAATKSKAVAGAQRIEKPAVQRQPSRRSGVEPNVTRLPQHLDVSGTYSANNHRSASSEKPRGASSRPAPAVELESIVPLDGKPPTLAAFSTLSRTPGRTRPRTSTSSSDSSGDEFEVYGGKGNLTASAPVRPASSTTADLEDRNVDVFGFVYDATPGDIKLLRQARKASTPAPACLTGIRVGVAARGGDSESENGRAEVDSADDESEAANSSLPEQRLQDLDTSVNGKDDPTGASEDPVAGSSSFDGKSRTGTISLLGVARTARPSTDTSQLNASSVAAADSGPNTADTEVTLQPSTADTKLGKTVKAPHLASHTVRRLLDQLKVMHSKHQDERKAEWDDFIAQRRQSLSSHRAESPARDRSKSNVLADDQPPVSQDEFDHGLIGFRQLMNDNSPKGHEDYQRFLALVQSGIPLAHRPKIWAECSGASEVAEPGRYQELLAEHESQETEGSNQCLMQIDLDIHRTMPTNIYFGGDGPGVAKLRRVLVAYSWYNPEIGYCQGMNNLAATLLLTHATEEEAFWVLVCIVEKMLPAEYYTSHLLVSQADQRVLIDLVQEMMPKLLRHFEDLGVDLPAVTFAWFLSLYTDCLPVEVSKIREETLSPFSRIQTDVFPSLADLVPSLGPPLPLSLLPDPLPYSPLPPPDPRIPTPLHRQCFLLLWFNT